MSANLYETIKHHKPRDFESAPRASNLPSVQTKSSPHFSPIDLQTEQFSSRFNVTSFTKITSLHRPSRVRPRQCCSCNHPDEIFIAVVLVCLSLCLLFRISCGCHKRKNVTHRRQFFSFALSFIVSWSWAQGSNACRLNTNYLFHKCSQRQIVPSFSGWVKPAEGIKCSIPSFYPVRNLRYKGNAIPLIWFDLFAFHWSIQDYKIHKDIEIVNCDQYKIKYIY